jgi:hypothetical protein
MFGAALLEIEAEHRDLEARMAAWLGKLADYDRTGQYGTDGFASAAVALRAACRMNPGVAHRHVELARKLTDLPDIADAFSRGEISCAHARVVANAHTPERAADITNIETQLVAAARDHTPHELGALVRHVTDAIDGDGGAATDDAQLNRRRLHVSSTFDGMVAGDFVYDHTDGEFLKAALRTGMARDHPPGDPRTTAQRRADAHLNLVRRGLARGDLARGDVGTTTRPVRRHFIIAIDVHDLPGYTADTIANIRTEARRNGFLSAATLERISCDAQISRVVTAGKSEILDVGRTTHTTSPALWKALVIRDRHCQAPGCDRPPNDCEAHHIVHWALGGPTDLENLKLYCWHHHREQHRHDAQARAG